MSTNDRIGVLSPPAMGKIAWVATRRDAKGEPIIECVGVFSGTDARYLLDEHIPDMNNPPQPPSNEDKYLG